MRAVTGNLMFYQTFFLNERLHVQHSTLLGTILNSFNVLSSYFNSTTIELTNVLHVNQHFALQTEQSTKCICHSFDSKYGPEKITKSALIPQTDFEVSLLTKM
jgi:hypothetical protein